MQQVEITRRLRRGRCSASGASPNPIAGSLFGGFPVITGRNNGGNAGAAVPTMPLMDQGADPVPERQTDRHRPRRPLPLRCSARSPGVWAGPHLLAGALFQNASARTCARRLRTPAQAVAGIFRRQAHRRPDGAHRLETDRINLFISLHFLDFATDVADDPDDLGHPGLDQSPGWRSSPAAAADHRLADPCRAREAAHRFDRVDRIWAEVTNVLADTIPGIRVVKAFAQESREAARFRAANQHNLEVNDKVNKVWSLFGPTVTLLTEVGLLIIWGSASGRFRATTSRSACSPPSSPTSAASTFASTR